VTAHHEPFAFVRRLFLPFAVGYFLSQAFRSANAVVSADLIRELSLDAWTIGFLTSAYFLAFAAAQLPVGVALDRFGPRRTESALLVVAAIGGFSFAGADTIWGLVLARGLIGLGVSACLMASFHAFALFAPDERLPFLNGAVMAAGALGALAATAPLEWAVSVIGWRWSFAALAVATLLSALFVFRSAPEFVRHAKDEHSEISRGLGDVLRDRSFWSVAPLSVVHQGSYLAIQSLWAGPWLRDVAALPRDVVGNHLLVLAGGMGIGFLSIGYASERLGRRGVSPLYVWVACAVCFQLAQGALALGSVEYALVLWFSFGVFGASGMLGYVIVTRWFPRQMTGRVNASLNVFVFTGAFAIQAGIGAVIGWWSEPSSFSPEGYRAAFAAALGLQVLCLAWLLITTSWRRRVHL
jgi:MFS family permease